MTMRMNSAGGLSKTRLGRMHDIMAGHVDDGGVPGLVTLVGRLGEIYVDAAGKTAIGGNLADPADDGFAAAAARDGGFLDLGLSGHRRLTMPLTPPRSSHAIALVLPR